ncbi:hypothetical protein [Actinoplanes sp. RD1]|uniref:hypothetical protein n=1 Tax=Actinoplanes sp. RD1 TaxID=3064538 RepID=UPI002740EAC2|nr:hypothetical protein [Actinoplanes sp. RD1]
MRGGLDDALDRLARRDQLRRRATGEEPGTPPAVTELVEAIAAVVGRNPELAVTVGVEGAGDPTLFHFAVEDGIVQVSADTTVARRADEPPVDYIDVDPDEPHTPPHGYVFEQPTNGHGYPAYEQQAAPQPHPFAATPPPEVPVQTSPAAAYDAQTSPAGFAAQTNGYAPQTNGTGFATPTNGFADHSNGFTDHANGFEAPSNGFASPANGFEGASNGFASPTNGFEAPSNGFASPGNGFAEHSNGFGAAQQQAAEEQPGMPPPLAEPIPLRIDEQETEQAARRIAALLREDPSLLRSQE